jgi:hypothetical protein
MLHNAPIPNELWQGQESRLSLLRGYITRQPSSIGYYLVLDSLRSRLTLLFRSFPFPSDVLEPNTWYQYDQQDCEERHH